jgi:hypothetical protein
MVMAQDPPRGWWNRTVSIRKWQLLAALILAPLLVFWFRVVHQDDEILALSRNEVMTDAAGARVWAGRFVNTNSRTLRDVMVTVDFLDSHNARVGRVKAEAEELTFATSLDLHAPLPADAARLRIYSVQWRMDTTAADRWLHRASPSALMGPFREPWEFGYVMVEPGAIHR